jgi:hypothetical protein
MPSMPFGSYMTMATVQNICQQNMSNNRKELNISSYSEQEQILVDLKICVVKVN